MTHRELADCVNAVQQFELMHAVEISAVHKPCALHKIYECIVSFVATNTVEKQNWRQETGIKRQPRDSRQGKNIRHPWPPFGGIVNTVVQIAHVVGFGIYHTATDSTELFYMIHTVVQLVSHKSQS